MATVCKRVVVPLHGPPQRSLPLQRYVQKKDVFRRRNPFLKPFLCVLGPSGQPLASPCSFEGSSGHMLPRGH